MGWINPMKLIATTGSAVLLIPAALAAVLINGVWLLVDFMIYKISGKKIWEKGLLEDRGRDMNGEMRSYYDFSKGERGKHHKHWEVAREHILAMLAEEGLAVPQCPECRRPMELVIAIVIRPLPSPVKLEPVPAWRPTQFKPVPAWHCRHCWGNGCSRI